MMVTDPVADLLTRIRNASAARHDYVEVPASKLSMEIVRILQGEGFIRGFEMLRDRRFPTASLRKERRNSACLAWIRGSDY